MGEQGFWRQWWRWWRTYRAYALLLVVIGLTSMIGSGASSVRTTGDALSSAADSTAGATPGAVGATGATSGDGTPASGAGPGGAVGPAAGGGGPEQPTAPSGTPYPGIGTPEALANPKCDPATGRIRFPSLFAPQCVLPWPEGADNGGATSMGVTADTIRIVMLDDPSPTPPSADRETRQRQTIATINAFADNYELWGRHLDIQFYGQTGTDEASQRADAIQVATELQPFLASSFLFIGATTPRTWAAELAARGVISWDENATYAETHAQPGYRWAYSPDDRLNALHLAEYVGKRLAGRPAVHAGDDDLRGDERAFGLIYDDAWDVGTFQTALAERGLELTDAVSFNASEDTAVLQQQALTQMARFKDVGVNNVILVAGALYSGLITRAASDQNFNPEWTVSGWSLQDTAVLTRLAMDQDQWAHASGLGLVPPLEQPIAISERNFVHEWATGQQPEDEATNGQTYLLAKSIIAGIHLAGPNLTPETFRDAMFRLQPSGGNWCGCVTHTGASFGHHNEGYGDDDYVDTDDYAEKWWDPDQVGEDEVGITSAGVYLVVDGGRRYGLGQWPSTDPDVFNPANAVVGFREQPANDRWPDYPRPGPQ